MGQGTRTGLFDPSVLPQLAEIIRLAIRKEVLSIRTHTVGTVVAYNNATQTADVQVDILQVVRDNVKEPTQADPSPTITQPPLIIMGLPVHWHGTQSAHATTPLLPGDKGEIHVCDRNLSKWLEAGIPSDPIGMWTHALKDGVFYPSSLPTPNKLPPTRPDAYTIEGPLIALGYAAAEFAAKGTSLVAAIDALLLAGVNAGGPGAVNFTAATTAWNAAKASTLSTKVLVE